MRSLTLSFASYLANCYRAHSKSMGRRQQSPYRLAFWRENYSTPLFNASEERLTKNLFAERFDLTNNWIGYD